MLVYPALGRLLAPWGWRQHHRKQGSTVSVCCEGSSAVSTRLLICSFLFQKSHSSGEDDIEASEKEDGTDG